MLPVPAAQRVRALFLQALRIILPRTECARARVYGCAAVTCFAGRRVMRGWFIGWSRTTRGGAVLPCQPIDHASQEQFSSHRVHTVQHVETPTRVHNSTHYAAAVC